MRVFSHIFPCRLVGKKKEDGTEMNKWFSSTSISILFNETISIDILHHFDSCSCKLYSFQRMQGSPICHWSWIVQRNLLEQYKVFIEIYHLSAEIILWIMFWLFIFCFLRIESKRYYELKVILFLEILDLFVDLTLTTAGIWRVEIWIQHQGVCAASWKQRRVKTFHRTIVPVQMTINDCNRKCAKSYWHGANGIKVMLKKQTIVNLARTATAPAFSESRACNAETLLDKSFKSWSQNLIPSKLWHWLIDQNKDV